MARIQVILWSLLCLCCSPVAAEPKGIEINSIALKSNGDFTLGTQGWFLTPSWGHGTPWNRVDLSYYREVSVWNDAFLKDLRGYGAYRMMDWAATNHSRVQHWSERRLPTDPGNREIYVDASTKGVVPGMAYELMFDLAQRAHLRYLWITLPMLADDDYVRNFAQLAKKLLPTGTTLVVEWSNEPDGGWFTQSEQAIERGVALGLPGPNRWYQGAAYTTLRTIAVSKALREAQVDAIVVRCTVGNQDLMARSLDTIYASRVYNPTGEKIHALGMQFYFGAKADGKTYDLTLAKRDIDQEELRAVWLKNLASQHNIRDVVVYEFNNHTLLNAATFNESPDAAQALVYSIERASHYFLLGCLYTDASSWSNKPTEGAWGIKKVLGGPDTLKSIAVAKWLHQQHESQK